MAGPVMAAPAIDDDDDAGRTSTEKALQDFAGMLGQELGTLRAKLSEFHNSELATLRERNESLERELADVKRLGGASTAATEKNVGTPEPFGGMHDALSALPSPSRPDDILEVQQTASPFRGGSKSSRGSSRSNLEADSQRYVMREAWLALQKVKLHRSSRRTTRAWRAVANNGNRPKPMCGQAVDNLMRRFMVPPAGWKRTSWVALCMLMLFYDFTVVPMMGSFELPTTVVSDSMASVSAVFWSTDIVLMFSTGIYDNGRLEMRPSIVARAYMRGWLMFDILMVSVEVVWLALAQSSRTELSLLRGARLLRWLRLLRLAKWRHAFDDAMLTAPEALVALSGIIKILLGMPIAIHLLTCIWYTLGRADADGWAHSDDLEQTDIGRLYLKSMHWVIASLAGSYSSEPRSSLEYLFSSALVLSGIGFIAFLIAKATMAVYTLERTDKAKLQKFVRQYLRVRGVSTELSIRVSNHVAHRTRSLGNNLERETKLLEALPEVLQMDLHQEVRGPVLDTHRFFRDLREWCPRTVAHIIHEAVEGTVSIPDELVFSLGDACKHVRFIESGHFRYDRALEDSAVLQRAGAVVASLSSGSTASTAEDTSSAHGGIQCTRGRCLSEAALWTKWAYQGDLSAETEGTALLLDAAKIGVIVRHYDAACIYVARYAKYFVSKLNHLAAEEALELSDLVDIELPDSFDDLVPKVNAEDHLVFISHFKMEAGTEALLIEESIERMIVSDPSNLASELHNPAFLDSSDLEDLGSLRDHVKRSHNLILLLTDNVLTRPWCLIEIVTAKQCGVQIVPVAIQRPGVAFAYPDEKFYKRFREGHVFSQTDMRILLGEGVSLVDAEEAIRNVFLKIALPYSPHKSANIRQAELDDILARCKLSEDVSRHE